mmetsp:Transcript_22785/g.58030  ORF Transcript_22785/g.58030 Transcript_22785/m.58030 type:complete len:386 (-) Transcript_22785:446-1603(-)
MAVEKKEEEKDAPTTAAEPEAGEENKKKDEEAARRGSVSSTTSKGGGDDGSDSEAEEEAKPSIKFVIRDIKEGKKATTAELKNAVNLLRSDSFKNLSLGGASKRRQVRPPAASQEGTPYKPGTKKVNFTEGLSLDRLKPPTRAEAPPSPKSAPHPDRKGEDESGERRATWSGANEGGKEDAKAAVAAASASSSSGGSESEGKKEQQSEIKRRQSEPARARQKKVPEKVPEGLSVEELRTRLEDALMMNFQLKEQLDRTKENLREKEEELKRSPMGSADEVEQLMTDFVNAKIQLAEMQMQKDEQKMELRQADKKVEAAKQEVDKKNIELMSVREELALTLVDHENTKKELEALKKMKGFTGPAMPMGAVPQMANNSSTVPNLLDL